MNVYVCIKIRHTNHHHVALQTKMALLGGLFMVPYIKPVSTLCTMTATQPKIGAWAVCDIFRDVGCVPRQSMVDQVREISSIGRESNGVQPHAAFHLREARSSAEPAAGHYQLASTHMPERRYAGGNMHSVCAHRRMKHGKGNTINREYQDLSRSQKGFQVSDSRKET